MSVDEVAVQRVVDGDVSVRLSREEKRAAAVELHRRGYDRESIARRVAMSWSDVRDLVDSLGGGPASG